MPLTSNEVVEQVPWIASFLFYNSFWAACVVTIYCFQALGQYGIICLEDLVNEIANVGPHFKEVTSFLCPFALNKPEKALQGKKKRFVDGGDSGNREGEINELISKMN